MNEGSIILIDDDHDDLELIKDGLLSLDIKNEIIAFDNSLNSIKYIEKTRESPFLILCDINMPEMDGFELRRRSFANPVIRLKTVPFLFLSTSGDHPSIKNAYELSIQGYFIKPSSFEGIQEMLKNIITYWNVARRP